MHYTSTRDTTISYTASSAIITGLSPEGGLFVPQSIPRLSDPLAIDETYQQTAFRVFSSYLTDFPEPALISAINGAYNPASFDIPEIIKLAPLDAKRSVLELWHGPTAAFKDMALQIMPFFMESAKTINRITEHTVILVATSGDTGKAALEGFKNRPGVTVIVFYPAEGVSQVQRLQMVTTAGSNTHVIAVEGNFDDCQNGVKKLFGDRGLAEELAAQNMAFSSANSINWGRLCPQIVYYVRAYQCAISQGLINRGDAVNFCVPTGNFGNILAAWYAQAMGLPIARLICASNRNRILTDFFTTGTYNRNRVFHKTMSPSMDILISSNLERFLFEMGGHDPQRIKQWSEELASAGTYTIDAQTKKTIDAIITPGWANESAVEQTIGEEFRRSGYVLDTHTAVAAAVAQATDDNGLHTIIDATASPYKFGRDVLRGLTGEEQDDEFNALNRIAELSKSPVHPAMQGLRQRPICHDQITTPEAMASIVRTICRKIAP